MDRTQDRTLSGSRSDELVPLTEAARRLGITYDAARCRLARGTLEGEKRGDRWFVFVANTEQRPESDPATEPNETGLGADPVRAVRSDARLITALEERIASLEQHLATRDEEIHRRDHIIAGLVERVRELPAGETAQHAAQNAHSGPQTRDRAGMTSDPMTPASDSLALVRRRWWRRMRGVG
jgi:hypothetical protein